MRRAASVADLGTILGVWAHPDDEAYLSAGLMALARRNGQRVVVATATAGEHGTPDPAVWPPPRLATVRRRELTASLAAVGVHEHHWLGWPDGGCADVPTYTAVGQIEGLIRAIRPDTIVTFAPDGMTGHPDHRAVSSWTAAAWTRTGRRARVLHATVTPEFHAAWSDVNDLLGIWDAIGEPPVTAEEDLGFQVSCTGHLLDQKLAALRAHASQTSSAIAAIGEERFRLWWQTESFADARQRPRSTASRPRALSAR
jgi:LmbE family N-acetylglucosaminyl deacetylase